MTNLFGWFALSIVASLASTTGQVAYADTTYSCTAVDRKASVGVKDGTAVSTTTGDRICNFSVSGAAVNATRTADANTFKFAEAFNELSQRDFSLDTFDNAAPTILMNLILGPFFPGQFDFQQANDFENEFRSRGSDVSNCIQSARSGGSQTVGDSESRGLMCGLVAPEGREISVDLAPGISVQSDERILLLGFNTGNERFMVFLPTSLLQGGVTFPIFR